MAIHPHDPAEAQADHAREAAIGISATDAFSLNGQAIRMGDIDAALRKAVSSELTLGHTAVEFRGAAASSTQWVTDADADAVFDLLTTRLAAS